MTTNSRSRPRSRAVRPRIPAQRTTRSRTSPAAPSPTPLTGHWHQHVSSAGTTLTALAAVAALLFTGVSVQQASGELENRRKELQIAQEGQVTSFIKWNARDSRVTCPRCAHDTVTRPQQESCGPRGGLIIKIHLLADSDFRPRAVVPN